MEIWWRAAASAAAVLLRLMPSGMCVIGYEKMCAGVIIGHEEIRVKPGYEDVCMKIGYQEMDDKMRVKIGCVGWALQDMVRICGLRDRFQGCVRSCLSQSSVLVICNVALPFERLNNNLRVAGLTATKPKDSLILRQIQMNI